ncbi:MAG: hypothetical protein NVS4B12_16980 [Ktedonobacteraceae bacterium]
MCNNASINLPFSNLVFYNDRAREGKHRKSSFKIGVYAHDDNTNRITGSTVDKSCPAVARR